MQSACTSSRDRSRIHDCADCGLAEERFAPRVERSAACAASGNAPARQREPHARLCDHREVGGPLDDEHSVAVEGAHAYHFVAGSPSSASTQSLTVNAES
jgi:hypothetical protein